MSSNYVSVKVAVVQAALVLFEREKTVEKACQLVADAAERGAKIVLLPISIWPKSPGASWTLTWSGTTPDQMCLNWK